MIALGNGFSHVEDLRMAQAENSLAPHILTLAEECASVKNSRGGCCAIANGLAGKASGPWLTFALLRGTRMPFRVREVRPAKPQAASFTEALAGLIARFVHARYAVAEFFLGFYACRTHRVLQLTEDDSRGRRTSASGFHNSHFIDATARNIHPAVGS